MARREPFSNSKRGIRGNHQSRSGKTVFYSILLLVVMAIMIGLGRINKRQGGTKKTDKAMFSNPLPNSGFTKEGELELFNSDEKLIVKLDIEIADDDAQTTKGLMYRRSMEEKQGMLFIFPSIEERSFWMKNTYIPLDLIFLDENKVIVHIHEGAQPKSKASLPSIKPAKYVLEVNEGFSARNFLEVGGRMAFVRTY
jgi:uncharacterized membrane protein (UPF0127 family)